MKQNGYKSDMKQKQQRIMDIIMLFIKVKEIGTNGTEITMSLRNITTDNMNVYNMNRSG